MIDKEQIQKEVNKRFPTEENECGEREFIRKSCINSFEEGVEWALKQVKNNGVLGGVIKCRCIHDIDERFPSELINKKCDDCGGVL